MLSACTNRYLPVRATGAFDYCIGKAAAVVWLASAASRISGVRLGPTRVLDYVRRARMALGPSAVESLHARSRNVEIVTLGWLIRLKGRFT